MLTQVKHGQGTQSNSASWWVAYSVEHRRYFAILRHSSPAGSWISIYKVPRRAYKKAGTFADDGYKTERMLRKGKRIYRFEYVQNSPESVDLLVDKRYRDLSEEMQQLR